MINDKMRRLVPVLLAALIGCSNTPTGIRLNEIPAGAVNVAWNDAGAVRVSHAYYSGIRQSVQTVISNDGDWRAIWATYTANQGTPPAAPAIDFSRHEVLVAALGERSSGGYDITVSRIATAGDYLYVELTSTRPGSRCGVTAALTQPVDMVRIPRQHPPVMFVEKMAQHDC